LSSGDNVAEKVKIPIAIFEYTADFTRPIVALWMDRAEVLQALFDELSKWTIDLNDVEPITTGKPSEQGVKIRLSTKFVTVFFGPSSFRFTKENSSWDSAEETIEILDIVVRTLIRASGAEFVSQKTSVSLHVQPTAKGFLEILRPFFSPVLEGLRPDKATTGASIVKWESGRVVVDGSAALANALYLRFERVFDVSASYTDIATVIRKDETALFQALDIEEDVE
jgi:hypothetical protein